MIFEITLEISNVAAGFGGVEVVANPGDNSFTINLDWIEVAIAVSLYVYITNKAFRHLLMPTVEMLIVGWRKLRAIEWRL